MAVNGIKENKTFEAVVPQASIKVVEIVRPAKNKANELWAAMPSGFTAKNCVILSVSRYTNEYDYEMVDTPIHSGSSMGQEITGFENVYIGTLSGEEATDPIKVVLITDGANSADSEEVYKVTLYKYK